MVRTGSKCRWSMGPLELMLLALWIGEGLCFLSPVGIKPFKAVVSRPILVRSVGSGHGRRADIRALAGGADGEGVLTAAGALKESVDESMRSNTFVRVTLSQSKQGNEDGDGPERIQARVVQLTKGPKLQLQIHYARRDETKNIDLKAAGKILADYMQRSFTGARVFTTTGDVLIEKSGVKRVKATFTELPSASHDKAKKRRLSMAPAEVGETAPAKAAFLHELEVLGPNGQPRSGMADKLRQIERFVEILDHLVEGSELARSKEGDAGKDVLRMLDMGAGKGYLTFAAYEHLRGRGFDVQCTGIEMRRDLCENGNDVAERLGYDSLRFVEGTIDAVASGEIGQQGAGLVVALHACDVATDDALFQGVRMGAQIIICAPCCHKEVRRQIEKSMKGRSKAGDEGESEAGEVAMQGLLRHGILLERQAEIVTDAIRALALEIAGYKAQVLEFISNDHTRKNLMITAVKRGRRQSEGERRKHRTRLQELLKLYDIRDQKLLSLLGCKIDPSTFAVLEGGWNE